MVRKTLATLLAFTGALVMVLSAVPAAQAKEGDWIFRTRAIVVAPDDSYDDDGSGLDLEAKSDVAFDIDLVRFFTDNVALELTALVSSHEVDSALGSLGSVRILPPVLTVQYHFIPEGKIRPYVGAGVNYTVFYDETGLLDQLDAELDDTFGLAAQAGADIMLTDTMSLNLDLKYVDLTADVEVGGADAGEIDINPWIFGVGLGCRF